MSEHNQVANRPCPSCGHWTLYLVDPITKLHCCEDCGYSEEEEEGANEPEEFQHNKCEICGHDSGGRIICMKCASKIMTCFRKLGM